MYVAASDAGGPHVSPFTWNGEPSTVNCQFPSAPVTRTTLAWARLASADESSWSADAAPTDANGTASAHDPTNMAALIDLFFTASPSAYEQEESAL
jgi:hypothetical protein